MLPVNSFKVFAISFLIAATGMTATAQISGDEGSANYLAAQCAMSSGFPAENYSLYGEKLALTLSSLDATQQERVFGFLPMPGGSATAPGKTSENEFSPGAQPEGSKNKEGLLDGLLSGVTDLIQGMQQPENPAPAIMGGNAPNDNAGDSNPPTTSGASPGTPGGTGPIKTTAASSGTGTNLENSGQNDDEDGNNGHGNSGGFDPSNPGKGNGKKSSGEDDGDGNNGHGNSGGSDPSNPGKERA